MAQLFVVQLLGLVCMATIALSCEPSPEDRLIQELLENYNPVVKPRTEDFGVQLGLELLRVEPNYERNVLSVNFWPQQTWKDNRLAWNPADYDGISSIRLNSNSLWRPDLVLYNQADSVEVEDVLALVNSDGTVYWIPLARATVDCWFTDNACSAVLKFGSWTYSAEELGLEFLGGIEDMSTTYYTARPDVAIKTSAVRNSKEYPGYPGTYIDLTFNIDVTKN